MRGATAGRAAGSRRPWEGAMEVESLGWPAAARWGLVAVTAFPVVVAAAVLLGVPSARPVAAIPLLAVIALDATLAAAFGRLRVAVDDAALTVGFGPFRDRLPLDRIVACGPTTYRWQDFGGWGIRVNPRRRVKLYNVAGDGGRAVRVLLDDGRAVLFSSRDPAAACQALRAHRPAIGDCDEGAAGG